MLNQYEAMIAMDVVAPDDIPVAFEGAFQRKLPVICGSIVFRYWWPR